MTQYIQVTDNEGHFTPEFEAMIEVVVKKVEQGQKKGDLWYNQKEAMAFLRVKSKEKMAAIRRSKAVVFKKDGGVYKYEKASLVKYLNS